MFIKKIDYKKWVLDNGYFLTLIYIFYSSSYRGANVNILNKDKSTPLHFAVTTGNFPLVKLLLCHGADITIKDIQG